jgi:ribosome recycling factor
MYNDIIQQKKSDLDGAIEFLKSELGKLRTGTASPQMVENLLVDYYGSKTPLKHVANINVPEPRLITISPWDKGTIAAIEGAIRQADLGLNPANDGQIIRIPIPSLTEERRKELVKVLNQKVEEARISVRNVREEIWKKIQETEKEGTISEDDKFRGKDKLQEVIDEYNKKIEGIREKKEKEMLTI